MPSPIKQALAAGRPVFGSWLALCSPLASEIMAHAGHDFLMVDGEHSAVGNETALAMAQAMGGTPCVPLMRVASNDPVRIKQALDLGMQGVIVPMVNSAAEAHQAVAACRYPPEGIRGFASSRASLWGGRMQEYVRSANADTCVIIEIEHPQAVERAEEILAVPGVDVAYVGVADLASFMGFTGQIGELDPKVDAAIAHVVEVAGRLGVALGIHCLTAEAAAARVRQGFGFVAVGGDARYVSAMARDNLAELRRLTSG